MDNYVVIGEFVLEDLYKLPSSSLYRFLKNLKKNEFKDNEQIIFYNYGTITSDILDHLYETLLYVDIPYFFVKVITNQKSTIEYLRDKLTVEFIDCPEQKTNIIPLYLNTSNQYCAHAWVGVHVWPDGSASPCCDARGTITKPDGTNYNIKESTVKEMLDSKWMSDLRQSFRKGQQHPACDNCFKREQLGFESRRTITPYKLDNVWGYINWEEEGQLHYFGSHLGNICNLKCRICSESFSSSIANESLMELPADQRKGSSYYTILKDSEWVYDKKFWDYLKENANTIKNFEILGGEPFVLKENIEFINWLIDNNLDVGTELYFTTNGTQPLKFLEKSKNFKRIEITVSIDNVGDRFEFERYGANWESVESNLKNLIAIQNSHSNLKIDLAITINIQNIFYLPEIIEWSQLAGFNSYYCSYVSHPKEMSINSLTKDAKEIVLNKLKQCNIDKEIITYIESSTGSDGVEFCKKMKRLDSLRKQNFAELYPEIAVAMGYNKF